VKGEILQISGPDSYGDHAAFDYYLKKTYYKTGSLMANSCKAEALLAGCDEEVQEIAFLYGKHIGLAFQLVDDLLDYEGCEKSLGKPALNDLRSGLATAPVMFAQKEFPELQKLMGRKFAAPGDIDKAIEFVNMSSGLTRTRQLAIAHAEAGVREIMKLKESRERNALVELARKVVNRNF
jgi:geranyl diphosphate synthase